MKSFVFPYNIVNGKLDNIDSSIKVNLTDQDATRLVRSAKEGGRVILDEDEEIRDIFDQVYEKIISTEKEGLLNDPSPVEYALSWSEEENNAIEITELQIDQYLEDLVIRIYYPENLQLLKKVRKKVAQSVYESVTIERELVSDYINSNDSIGKVVYTDGGTTLFNVPKSFSGVFVVSSTVRNIEKNAFNNCKRITEVTIENGVSVIPEWAFDGCKSLIKITVPPSVKRIEFNAFANCNELKQVELSEGLEYLDSTAFRACFKLETLRIPASVKEISLHINSYNNGIKQLFIMGKDTIIDDSHGGNWNRITVFVKPESLASQYVKTHNINYIDF